MPNEVRGLFDNLQIGPVWLILIGVVIGVFVAGRFPGLLNWLPGIFQKPEPQEAVEERVAEKVYDKIKTLLGK